MTIGIDIGGSKIRAIVWNGKKVLSARQVKTPKNLTEFKSLLSELVAGADNIGIGAAGIISGTKIVKSPNIKYLRHFDFKTQLGHRVSKLKLGNDAQCFARAVCPLKGTCAAVTLGTGIGRGLSKNGKILKIRKFERPEKWEKRYQKIFNDDATLAKLVAENLIKTLRPYKPEILVFGGGVMRHENMLSRIKREFVSRGWRGLITGSRYGDDSVAVGAALLK